MAVGKIFGKSAAVLLAGIIAGTILLTLAYMLPVNPENRQATYKILEDQGGYPRTSLGVSAWDEYFHSFYPDVQDGSSDSVMLYMAMDTSEGNPLVRAMRSHNDYIGDYNYYWHGYVSILRPLCLLFDLSELRILNGMCQLLVIFLLAFVIGREKGMGYVLMLLTSYLLLSPMAISMGMHFSGVFYIAYCGTLVLLLKRDFFAEKYRYVYFFIAVGMLANYFDLLTYPLFTWGCPLIWWLVMEERERGQDGERIGGVKSVIVSGIGWIAGYALMWTAKWGIASIVLGTDVFESAINQVFFRSGVREGGADGLWERLNAIYVNWKHYGYKLYAMLLIGWLLWWFFGSMKRGWHRSEKRYAFFLIGISSVVWYVVLSNQTALHHFFTHRNFNVSITAFLAIVLGSLSHEGKDAASLRKERIQQCLVWGGGAVLGLLLMLSAKEELMVTNGPEAFRRVPMDSGLEAEFIPSFDVINRFGLGLECAGSKGQFEIRLWEGDRLKCEETFLVIDGENLNYQERFVDWKLDGGKSYRLTVEAVDNDASVYIWVTEGGQLPLAECRNLSVDGEETEGQLLMGIYYRDRAGVPRSVQFFLVMTGVGIAVAAFYVFWPAGGKKTRKA